LSLTPGWVNTHVREEGIMRKALVAVTLILLMAGAGFAQKPVRNVSGAHHPNLAAAQRLCTQAFEKLTAAQRANEFDMDGHAQKAKQLLEEANREMKQAAEAANRHK
jgi:hypothetical protein